MRRAITLYGAGDKSDLTLTSILRRNELAPLNNNDHSTLLQSDSTGTNRLNPRTNQGPIHSTWHFLEQAKTAQRQANKTASLSQLIPTQVNPYLEAIK